MLVYRCDPFSKSSVSIFTKLSKFAIPPDDKTKEIFSGFLVPTSSICYSIKKDAFFPISSQKTTKLKREISSVFFDNSTVLKRKKKIRLS